jgi:hypothetical protein
MKRKMRKFAEGGFSSAQEEWLGGADRTDPYILARMRSAVPDEAAPKTTSRDFDAIDADMVAPSRDLTAPITVTKTKTSVTAAPKATPKPASESPEEYKARMEGLVKKQALERVEPENYVLPGGILKAGLKAITSRGLKTYTPEAIKQIGNQSVKRLENNATKMLPYDKAGSLAAKRAERAAMRDVEMKRGNARNYGIDPDVPGSASALDALRKDIGGGAFAMKKGGKVKSYKSGGSVSSASKRADGCAIRGKTRA